MLVRMHMCDRFDKVLLARMYEAWDRYMEDRTPENLAVYRRAFHQLTDWVQRGKLRRDSEWNARP
jgi:hypothetical protein